MTPQGEALLLRMVRSLIEIQSTAFRAARFHESGVAREVSQHIVWLRAQNEPLNQPDPSPGLTESEEE